MNTILVWYLVTWNSAPVITWSPPMATQQECERVKEVFGRSYSRCIQLNEVLK